MLLGAPLSILALISVNVAFPQTPSTQEQIVLRWLHFIAGIIWLGLLYFFTLVNTPFLNELEGSAKSKVYALLMPRAMWWFRWGSVVAWLAGFRYFMILMQDDARNAGHPSLFGYWMGTWFALWVAAYVVLHGLLMAGKGPLNNGWVFGALAALVVTATAWLVLSRMASPAASNRTLSIAVGGGLGTIMFLNVWGIVWRCQKKLIAWHKAAAEQSTPLPPEAAKLARRSFLAARLNFWLSFPMLFFMAASSHYPFLSGK